MTGDEYVRAVLSRHSVEIGPLSAAERVGNSIAGSIRGWHHQGLVSISFSGSYAKGTAVDTGTDVDLFLSYASDTPGTLADLYNAVYAGASRSQWAPRRQNVSIGMSYLGMDVDLVPARMIRDGQSEHSLYNRRRGTWIKTDVALHIRTVRDSKRLGEIKAIKIWRDLHKLDFPSIFLELVVIEALKGRPTGELGHNVFSALRYIAESIQTARVMDPANTNNVVSDDLTQIEKRALAAQAQKSCDATNWGVIIW